MVPSTQGQSFPDQQRPHGPIHKLSWWRRCSACEILPQQAPDSASLLQALLESQVTENLAAPRGYPCLLGVGAAKSSLQEGSGLKGNVCR